MPTILNDLSFSAMAAANEANLFASSPFSWNLPNSDVRNSPEICWVLTNIPLLPCNIVFKSRLNPKQADSIIETLLEKARQRRVPLRWTMDSGSKPDDLPERLVRHGFTINGPGPMMGLDLSAMHTELPQVPNLKIVEVQGGGDFETWCHLASVGFGIAADREPAMRVWFRAAMSLQMPMKLYLALENDEPVATSQVFLAEGVAGIFYVTTLEKARNRGIGTAVTLKPLMDAAKMGYRVAVLQASKLGVPVYRRIGFQQCGTITSYIWRNSQ